MHKQGHLRTSKRKTCSSFEEKEEAKGSAECECTRCAMCTRVSLSDMGTNEWVIE